MKSSKWILGLTAIMLVLVLAPSSFAQVNITISNTPSSTEAFGARLANTSDPNSAGAGITVSGALLANSTLTTTQLVLVFPVSITSGAMAVDGTMGATTANIPAGDAIQITGATGLFASVSAVASVQYAGTTTGGWITITLPGFGSTANTTSGSFRIIGIRGDMNGRAIGSSALTLNSIRLDNPGGTAGSGNANNYNLQTSGSGVTLVSSIAAGIGGFAQGKASGGTDNGTFVMFSNQSGGTFADSTATLVLTEGFVNAWRTQTQNSISGVITPYTGTGIRLTVSGLPAGVTLNITTSGAGSAGGTFSSSALTSATTTASTTTFTFSTTQIAAIDNVEMQLTLSGAPTGTLSVSTPITITATMAPPTTATAAVGLSGGVPTATGGIPRFDTSNLGPVTIGNIIAAQTTLLIPYAVANANFNVAIALSNTTKDPFVSGSATAASGVLRFDFFPTASGGGAGTTSTLTTGASKLVGSGLTTADGTLAAGATWTADLKSLLPQATPAISGDFVGYIFVQTNFLDAHGVYYLVTTGFPAAGNVAVTGALPIMVLPPPAATSRTNGGANAVESLSF